jgi:GNAT superfamily N-acetyltransferase
LQRSFEEFNVTDLGVQESIYQKYSLELHQNKLMSLELVENGNLVASAVTCYQHFYAACGPIKLSFLTQIIVQEEYRGRGYLRKLIEFAQDVDESNLSLGSIVIARRRVGNLYSKYGYRGFGVFPQVLFENFQERVLETTSTLVDWNKISIAYQKTYQDIPGSIYRSKDYWIYIKNEVNKGRFGLGYIQSVNDLGYFIYSNGDCVEIASTSTSLFPDLLQISLGQGMRRFKIGSNHPVFPVMVSAGGMYIVRPEREEGHMIKSYLGGEFLSREIDRHIERTVRAKDDEEKYSIDINLINEW